VSACRGCHRPRHGTSKRSGAKARAKPSRTWEGWGGVWGEGWGEQEERKTGGKTESQQRGRDQEGRRSVRPRARARARTFVCVPCSECTEQALLVRGHLSYDRSVPTLPAGAPASCLPPANLPPGSTDCPLLRPSTFTTAILPRTEPVGSLSFKLGTHARSLGCIRREIASAPCNGAGYEWTRKQIETIVARISISHLRTKRSQFLFSLQLHF